MKCHFIPDIYIYRGEVSGMTAKARTNLLKVTAVVSCMRQTIRFMLHKITVDFTISDVDMEVAWHLVQYSLYVFKCFKVISKSFDFIILKLTFQEKIRVELGELDDKPTDEELVLRGARKLKKLYELADTNYEVRLTKAAKFCTFPAKSTLAEFVQVNSLFA